ncbi:hypothetical protein RHMOL_Rhmol07G0118000 [Rhododendron molle]|uniref:Uncharacterized protein n=1 Tax=Rhododendron molle TaxID=49168 RepID=A0ACC0N0T3_RHOML|nr:hypothetical protein RHMOL_Rhmol07G0118000 [Rhododendron molle]
MYLMQQVKKFVPSSIQEMKNTEGNTAAAVVFIETHNEIIKEGKRWLKDLAGSCYVVSGLIASVMFASAITVPGDYGDNGMPNFRKNLIS